MSGTNFREIAKPQGGGHGAGAVDYVGRKRQEARVTSRLFIALLIGLAMVLAPLGMPTMAEATVPADHHGELAEQTHCDEEPGPDQHGNAADKSCCAATCLGLVAATATAEELQEISRLALSPSPAPFRRGTPTELPTPPPRAM